MGVDIVMDFFISYAREDAIFARALVGRLKEAGWDVWIDQEDIPPSVPWMTEIQHAIDESMMMIAIASPDWLASAACLIEVDLAEKGRVPVVRVTPDSDRLDDIVGRVVAAFRALPEQRAVALQANSAAAIWDSAGRTKPLLVRGQPLRLMRATLTTHPVDFSDTARVFIATSRQASIRRWILGLALGFIAPVLGLGIWVSLLVASKTDEQVAENVAHYTDLAEQNTYADWNIYSGLERSPSDVTGSYTDYYQLFSFLAERTPSSWDPVPVTDGGAQTAESPDGNSWAAISGSAIEVTDSSGSIKRLLASAPVSALAWSNDSRWIAVATSVGADVISVDNGQAIPLRGGSGTTESVRWDGASDVIVGGSTGSGTWRVLDASPAAVTDGVRYGAYADHYLYTVSAPGEVSKTDVVSGTTTVLEDGSDSTPTAMDSMGSTVVVAFDASEPFLLVIDATNDSSRVIPMPDCSPLALSLTSDEQAAYLACSEVNTNRTRVNLGTGAIDSQPMQDQLAYGVRALDDRVIWGGHAGLVSQSDLDLTPGGVLTTTCPAPLRKFVGAPDGSALFPIGDATGSFTCASRIQLRGEDTAGVTLNRLILPAADGHAAPDAATSPDGSLVAYGLSDGRVRVFTTSGFYPVYFAQVLPDQVRAVSFSDDGTSLVVAGLGGEIVILPLPTTVGEDRAGELVDDAVARLQNAIDWGIYTSTQEQR